VRSALCLLVALSLAQNARADNTPWATGVPKLRQEQANALFAEANTMFEQGKHEPAAETYRAAIALWDHPMIRFNMAVTLIRLDQLVEAADALEAALRYGKTPFTPELYEQAINYDRLLRGRVGTIAVRCEQAGVQIFLDGKRWFTCAGDTRVRVLAGEHLLLAQKSGMLTVSQPLFVTGEHVSEHVLALQPLEPRLAYPTRRWIPWSVAGTGTVIGMVGLGVWFAGQNQMDRFEARHLQECANRCTEELDERPALRDMRDGAELRGTIGLSLMVAGGAVALGGLVWATVLNRPVSVAPTIEVSPTQGGAAVVATWKRW
jgi:hypothetical protein